MEKVQAQSSTRIGASTPIDQSPSRHFKHRHKAVARTLVYALTLADADSYAALSDVIVMRLPPEERVGLAWATHKALEADEAEMLFDCTGAGMPGLPMEDKMEEAAFWADMAEPEELRAYCLATFKRMSSEDQAEFLAYVQERKAA